MAFSGVAMWQRPSLVRRNRNPIRRVHHGASYVGVAWLLFAACTGSLWALTRWWLRDPTLHADMVLLMKQLHVGYFSFLGLMAPLSNMAWWSIVGGAVVLLPLTASGTALSASLNIVPNVLSVTSYCCGIGGGRKRKRRGKPKKGTKTN